MDIKTIFFNNKNNIIYTEPVSQKSKSLSDIKEALLTPKVKFEDPLMFYFVRYYVF